MVELKAVSKETRLELTMVALSVLLTVVTSVDQWVDMMVYQ